MSCSLKNIKNLMKYLPSKDIDLGNRFVELRQFEELLDLVTSDIYIVSKDRAKEEEVQKYFNIDIDKLYELQTEVDQYLSLIDSSREEYDDDSAFIQYNFYE